MQNLLERRGELGVARAMQTIDVDKLTDKQVSLAEGHVRSCQLDVVKAENSNTALFLQWVSASLCWQPLLTSVCWNIRERDSLILNGSNTRWLLLKKFIAF